MRVLFILCLLPVFIFGEQLSLAELVDIALKNNPETQRVWANVKRAEATVGIVKSGEYPHVNTQGSLTHAREVTFPNGPNTIFTSYGAELNLNYILLDFGATRAAVRATKQALQASKWWANFSMQKIFAEVASNYYDYLNASQLLQTREASLEDARTILEAAEELYKAGLRSQADSLSAKAAVAEMRMAFAEQKAGTAFSYGKLLTAMGLSLETELQVETDPEEIKNPLFTEGISAMIAAAERQRADLMARQASFAGMSARVDHAKRARFPKLRALGQGGWFEYGKHKGSGYNYSAGLALDVPLFKGFEYAYQKRQALADVEISAAEIRELQQAIALEVLHSSELAKAAQESLSYSEEFFDEAYAAYGQAMESYKAGLISIFDLLQSQKFLSDARTKKAQTRTAWLLALAQLAFSIGDYQ